MKSCGNKRSSLSKIQSYLDSWCIEHFVAREFIEVNPLRWEGGEIALPPERLITHFYGAALYIDELRSRWGGPVKITSGYRPPEYNKAIGGAEMSAHTDCRAIDAVPLNEDRPQNEWFELAVSTWEDFKAKYTITTALGWKKYAQTPGDDHIHFDAGANHEQMGRSSRHVFW